MPLIGLISHLGLRGKRVTGFTLDQVVKYMVTGGLDLPLVVVDFLASISFCSFSLAGPGDAPLAMHLPFAFLWSNEEKSCRV